MKAALLMTFTGIGICLFLGKCYLALNLSDILLAIIISNLCGFLSLFTIVRSERVAWIKRTVLNHTLKTWALFLSLYFGTLLGLVPLLRSTHSLSFLALPLIMSSGIASIAFGPVQDFLVRRTARASLSEET